jgi:hypothetical protein
LKGPALAAYYPRKVATIKDLQKAYAPMFETFDEDEEDRFEHIKMCDRLRIVKHCTMANISTVSRPEGRVHQRRREQKKVRVDYTWV